LEKTRSPNNTVGRTVTVALYWIEGTGEYRQLIVTNHVAKVRSHTSVKWHYVPIRIFLIPFGKQRRAVNGAVVERPKVVRIA
jgi:hypothetical protein